MKRRLAAILAADAVGYSRLMGEDEEATLQTLNEFRAAIEGFVAEHEGRVFGTAGDSVIAEFASPVEAMRCAIKIQENLDVRNAEFLEERRMRFRVGVHVGDVMVEGDNLYGDGVNVAARLEGLADPGGICLSRATFDQVKNKLDLGFEELGAQEFKNIAEPVQAYRADLQKRFGLTRSNAKRANDTANRSALAVLPFVNLSQDPEKDYFADGLSEDLITALTAWHTFPVIARNSVFTYKGQAVKVQQVAAELDARYVLEGSVRKAGNRVRITAQLIDSQTGHHLWAQRFDRNLHDLFEVQDEITQRIVAIIAPEIEMAEQRRASMRHPKNLSAWDLYQRGMSTFYKFREKSTIEARAFFERAAKADPSYAQAYSGIAATYNYAYYHDGHDDTDLTKAFDAAKQAISLDETDASIHVTLGISFRHAHKHDLAVAEFERAVELNPNNAFAYGHLGEILSALGKHDQAIPLIEKAIRISPTRDPRALIFLAFIAGSHLRAHNHEKAVELARRGIEKDGNSQWLHIVLASSLGHLGQTAEAARELEKVEALQPGRIEWQFREGGAGYIDQSIHQHVLDGLRKAGWRGQHAGAHR